MKTILTVLPITIGLPFLATKVAVAADQQEIIVSAAIKPKKPFEETGKLFQEKYKEVKVTFNLSAPVVITPAYPATAGNIPSRPPCNKGPRRDCYEKSFFVLLT